MPFPGGKRTLSQCMYRVGSRPARPCERIRWFGNCIDGWVNSGAKFLSVQVEKVHLRLHISFFMAVTGYD